MIGLYYPVKEHPGRAGKGPLGVIYLDNCKKMKIYLQTHLDFLDMCAGKLSAVLIELLPHLEPEK